MNLTCGRYWFYLLLFFLSLFDPCSLLINGLLQKFIANLWGSGAFPVYQDHTHAPLLSFALLGRDLVGHRFTALCTLVSPGSKHRQIPQESAACAGTAGQASNVNLNA